MTPAPTGATAHAVLRYIERHGRPGLNPLDAAIELHTMLQSATFREMDDWRGIWVVPRDPAPEILLVVSADGIVETVLPPGAVKRNRRPRK